MKGIGPRLHFFSRHLNRLAPSVAAILTLCFLLPSGPGVAVDRTLPIIGTSFALTGVRVIGAPGRLAIADGVVVVVDGRIAAVGRTEDTDLPEDVLRIDCRGFTVLPGLIDSHTHRVLSPEKRCRAFLANGVTAIGNVGAALEDMFVPDGNGTGDGLLTPRVFQSGPVVTAPHGYPGPRHGDKFALEVASTGAARQAVRLLREKGADVIKVALEPGYDNLWPVLPQSHLAALVDEAHALGLVVRAHVEDAAYLERALDAEVDVIDHVPNRWSGGGPPLIATTQEGSLPVVSQALQTVLRRMAARDIILVPTLEAATRSTWDNAEPLAIVRAYHELGGRIALGTDAPFSGVTTGNVAREMELLAQAGLSPLEVIIAATRHAAQALGQADRLGTLLPGRQADLLVVDGDPLHDLQALRRPVMVIVGGRALRP